MDNMRFRHPVCSVTGVKERLDALHLRPNKALGQNFLIDAAARQVMLDHMPVKGCPVLEIGPGLGALTEGLIACGASPILAVDKDEAMIRLLGAGFSESPQLITLRADILRLPFAAMRSALGEGPIYVAGNLPYYITTPIALLLLGSPLPIRGMSFLVQREAAQRFWAAPGEAAYGPLAAAAQYVYHVEKGAQLPPSKFYPQPEVQSCCVHLTVRDEQNHAGFLPFLKLVFAMRRKTMLNNLLAGGFEKQTASQLLAECGIPLDARAETLLPHELYRLFKHANNNENGRRNGNQTKK